MTNILLGVVIVVLLALVVQNHLYHVRLVRWLDSLGDMLSDILSAILDAIIKGPKNNDD